MSDQPFNHFSQIALALPVASAAIVAKTALDGQKNIQGYIVANGQVVTGFLLNSVHVEEGEDPLTKYIVVGAKYGAYQNYGTRYLPARPFFEPGVEKTMQGFEAALSSIEDVLL